MNWRTGPRAGPLVGVLGLLLVAGGCSRTVQVPLQAIEDARLGARVKTALVNDAQLGTRVIEVRVSQGVATLSGLVASEAERTRALELARRVPGVLEARSQLDVGPIEQVAVPEAARDVAAPDRPPAGPPGAASNNLLAVGGALSVRNPAQGTLSSTAVPWPLVRVGRGRGLGLDFGFNWFQSDVSSTTTRGDLGRVKVRPVMGGLVYTVTDQARWSVGLSVVGGLAFNSVDIEETQVRQGQVIDVDNSLAVRPGVSFWYDVSGRVALNVFGGYLVTRPQTTFLENGAFTRRVLRADTAIVNVGVAYKLF